MKQGSLFWILGRQWSKMAAKKNAKMIFSLPDTIKKHVGKNYADNPTKVHKGVYYSSDGLFLIINALLSVVPENVMVNTDLIDLSYFLIHGEVIHILFSFVAL